MVRFFLDGMVEGRFDLNQLIKDYRHKVRTGCRHLHHRLFRYAGLPDPPQ